MFPLYIFDNLVYFLMDTDMSTEHVLLSSGSHVKFNLNPCLNLRLRFFLSLLFLNLTCFGVWLLFSEP